VLNRDELMQEVHGVEYMCPEKYRLEPEWVIVLLAALVHSGDLVLAIPGKKFDAGSMDDLSTTPLDELLRFKHIEQPKEWNLPALKSLFELLSLPPDMAQLVTHDKEEPVQELQKAIAQTLEKIVLAQQHLQTGFPFLGRSLLTEDEKKAYRRQLDQAKIFFESLPAYSSPGRLKNFRYALDEINAQKAGVETLREVMALQEIVAELGPSAAYLSQAEMVWRGDHIWRRQMEQARHETLERINLTSVRDRHAQDRREIARKLHGLKRDYITAYIALHTQARLVASDDKRKVALMQDERLSQMQKLATIELMPTTQLTDFSNRLGELKSCFGLTEQDLQAAPFCPHCNYKPSTEKETAPAGNLLTAMDDELDRLLAEWTKHCCQLTDPTIQQNLELLKRRRAKWCMLSSIKTLPELSHDFIHALKRRCPPGKIVVKWKTCGWRFCRRSPVTPAEMKQRFEDYLRAGKQRYSQVRIVLSDSHNQGTLLQLLKFQRIEQRNG
jgi:hypothetical protein